MAATLPVGRAHCHRLATPVAKRPVRFQFCYHRRVRRALPLFFSSFLMVMGCGPRGQVADPDWVPVPAADLGAVVARVGDVPIHAAQVLAEAKREGTSPRQALAALVDRQLLAEQARRDGWRPASASDPDVRTVLVQRILERDIEPKLRAEAIPDSVLRPIYDRARDTFVHPRLVDIGVLAIYTGPRMKDEPRRERARTARELDDHLRAHPPRSLAEFTAVASSPEWSSRSVVYSRFLQSPDRPLPPQVAREIVKLRTVGETSALLSDDNGFYIARYIDERPPENVTFEQTRDKLAAAYLKRWQVQEFLELTNRLVQARKVEAFFDRLPRNEQGP